MNTIDLTQFIRATDASQALGYRDRNAVAKFARDGKVPGAIQLNGKIWYVPRTWIDEHRAAPQKSNAGKPRGRENIKKTP